MSDMQLYLIALGAIIIAAVILLNWGQERRLSQDAIQRFDGPSEDALMDNFPIDRDRPISFDEETLIIEEHFHMDDDDEVLAPEPLAPQLHEIPEDTLLSELPGVTAPGVVDDVARAEVFPDAPDIETPLQTLADALIEEDEEPAFSNPAAPAAEDADMLPLGMDDQIDLIGLIHLSAPLTGAALRAALQPLPGFEKATQWLGRDDVGIWHPLTKDQEQTLFFHMAGALQFADRSGAVSRECLRKFQLKMDTVAEQLGAELEWHGTDDPLRYAADLDQFCIDVDVMVGFHIVNGSNGPFAATKLRGIAEAGGMRLHEDGAFHEETEEGTTLFTLVNHDQRPFTPELLRTAFISGISFQLDVPRVRNCPEAFNQMAMLARKMESSLGGRLIDDNQQPLSNESMDKIRDQLRIIYAKMVARGIIPGSPSALRLFS